MSKNIKLLSAAALAATVITPAVAVEASTPVNQDGVYFVYEGQNTYMTLTELVNDADMSYYVSELGLDKVTVIQDGEAGTYIDFLENKQVDLEDYDLPAGEYKDSQGNTVELTGDKQVGEVTSVKAINDLKVAKGTATDLKFLVNGEEELTKAEFEEKFEGYKVEFKYNVATSERDSKLGADHATGKVTAEDNFKYAVAVTNKDGEKVIEPTNADFAEVTVVDATVVTQINKIEAKAKDSAKAWDLDLAVTTVDKVTFVAAEYENALGQTNVAEEDAQKLPEDVQAPTVVKVVSNAPTVAYYDIDEGIIVRKDGKVTFTVEFDNGIKVVTPEVEVKVKATQTPTKVVAKDQKVAAGTTTVDFEILDQDGDLVRPATTVYYTVKAEGKEATSATSITPVTGGKGSIADLEVTAGKNVVTFYADEEAKKELGKVTITAVEVTGAPDAYDIKPALDKDGKEIVLDLNPNNKGAEKVSLNVEAKKDGVVVPFPAEGVTYAVKSSDDKIATADLTEEGKIEVTGVAKGEATITLYTTEGDMKTKVAEHTVTVDNTIEPIKELTFKDGVDAVIVKAEADENDVKYAVADAVKQTLTAGEESMIESVDTVKAQNIVIVTIKEEYGGGEYVLDAVYDFANLTEAEITAKVEGKEPQPAVAATVTEQDITFTAVAEGDEGNGIEIKFVASKENNNEEVEQTTAKVEGTTVTVTLAQAKGEEASVGVITATEADVVAAINALTDDSKIVTAALAEGIIGTEKVTATTDEVKTANGADEVEAVEAKPATLTLTFDEAVTLDGDFALFTKGTEAEDGETEAKDVKVTFAAKPVLSEEGTTITVALADGEDAEIAKDAVITKIDGVKAVKGIVLVKNVKVSAATE